MRSIVRFLPILPIGVLLAGPVHAQLTGFYPMGADSLSLNDDDFRLMIDAANGLLAAAAVAAARGRTCSSRALSGSAAALFTVRAVLPAVRGGSVRRGPPAPK